MVALGGILLGLMAVVSVTGTAEADEAECAAFYDSPERSNGATVYVALPPERVPPPLWPFLPSAACVTAPADLELDDPSRPGSTYIVHFVDAEYRLFLDVLRAFQRDGWFTDPGARMDPSGSGAFEPATLDDLEAAQDAAIVQAHFFAAGDGDVQLDYQRAVGTQDPAVAAGLTITLFLDRTFPAYGLTDPSVLSGLRTIAEAAPTGGQTAVIAGGAIMLMLVVGYPATLLNSVVGSRYDALVRRLRRPRRRADPDPPSEQATAGAPDRRARRLPGWLMWPGFAFAAIIGAFVDPAFGLNPMSARVVVTLFLSFLLFNLAAWAIVRRAATALQPDSKPHLRFRWGSLLIVALTVLASRLLEFHPGVIFGLVAGIAYAVALRATRSAIIVLVGSGFALALALAAWTGYSALAPVAEEAGENLPLVFAVEFLSRVTIKGVSTLRSRFCRSGPSTAPSSCAGASGCGARRMRSGSPRSCSCCSRSRSRGASSRETSCAGWRSSSAARSSRSRSGRSTPCWSRGRPNGTPPGTAPTTRGASRANNTTPPRRADLTRGGAPPDPDPTRIAPRRPG